MFSLGAALATVAMAHPARSGAVPVGTGLVVLIAAVLQRTIWKTRQLARCRQAPALAASLSADTGTAWRLGMRLGLDCVRSCANWTVVLLVLGVMDLRAMAAVAAAIAGERPVPGGERVAHVTGAAAVGAGLLPIVRAVTA